jgi:NDP-sugar pyrophosphorylase family protein
MPLAGNNGEIYVFQSNRMWSQVKTAGSAIYANRQYLDMYRKNQPARLASYPGKGDALGPKIVGDVFIHPTAHVHPSCVVSMYNSWYQYSQDKILNDFYVSIITACLLVLAWSEREYWEECSDWSWSEDS